MQTFMPYPSFQRSASSLDDKRLFKQAVEAKQIYLSLTQPEYGWKSHPAVKMWRGHEGSVLIYGLTCLDTWVSRSAVRRAKEYPLRAWYLETLLVASEDGLNMIPPDWTADPSVNDQFRAVLLHKNLDHYSRHGWSVDPAPKIVKWPEVSSPCPK